MRSARQGVFLFVVKLFKMFAWLSAGAESHVSLSCLLLRSDTWTTAADCTICMILCSSVRLPVVHSTLFYHHHVVTHVKSYLQSCCFIGSEFVLAVSHAIVLFVRFIAEVHLHFRQLQHNSKKLYDNMKVLCVGAGGGCKNYTASFSI